MLDGKELDFSSLLDNLDLISDEIISVDRKCESLTGMFPSGIFSIVTWIFAASFVRHEFVII